MTAAGPPVDLWNTPERTALRETVRTFAAKEILPHVEEWEDAGELPRSLHRSAGGLGLLGLGQPERVGGAGESVDQLVASEELILSGVPSGVLASLFTCSIDRKSTRLNSSHVKISYAVFCLKKKKTHPARPDRPHSPALRPR